MHVQAEWAPIKEKKVRRERGEECTAMSECTPIGMIRSGRVYTLDETVENDARPVIHETGACFSW